MYRICTQEWSKECKHRIIIHFLWDGVLSAHGGWTLTAFRNKIWGFSQTTPIEVC